MHVHQKRQTRGTVSSLDADGRDGSFAGSSSALGAGKEEGRTGFGTGCTSELCAYLPPSKYTGLRMDTSYLGLGE